MSGAFIHVMDLLIRSGLIAGACLALAALAGDRPIAERVWILRTGVALLVVLPAAMFLGPSLPVALLPAEVVAAPQPQPIWAGDIGPVAGVAVNAAVLEPSPLVLAAWAWAIGAFVVLARFAVGVWTLRRWTRAARPVTALTWTTVLKRLGGSRPPRLLVSSETPAPLSWGLPPGVVLISPECQARPETAAAVLAHELAHLRHRDWLFLSLSRLALGLFWFNPLVWRLHADLIARTEEAADAAAVGEVEPAVYARTLVSLAADVGQPAALAMAGPASTLARRIACIMKTRPAAPSRPLVAALTVAGLVAVATPIAAVELAPRPPAPPPAQVAPAPPPAPPTLPTFAALAPMAPPAPPAPPTAHAPEAPLPPAAPQAASHASEAERRAAHAAAEQARVHAAEAHVHAAAAREAALAHAAEARGHAKAAAAAGERARAAAEVHAAEAHRAAARAMAEARVQMARGAEQMMEGARTMRAEGERLRDPAYRAEQIERARERGDRVPTDAELLDLSRRLPRQADQLEDQARRMRDEAASVG